MNIDVWCETDVGLRRENNQDFFLFDKELQLFVVADGMGGHRGGEVASKLAAETILEVIRKSLKESGSRRINARVLITHAYEEASKRVYEASLEPNAGLEGMGTTLVVALFVDKTLYIGNVGDSRAYLFKEGNFWQITEDHSLMNEQLRAGLIRESDIAKFVGKNVITRSVGFERAVQVDVIERELVPGEMVLICSDGLSGLVTDQRIMEILAGHKPEETVPLCIGEAKSNGGDDNVTVMVLYARPQASQ